MNSKQRVVDTLSGKVPDKIPLGEFAIDYDIAEKILGKNTFYRAKAKTQLMLWEGRRDEVKDSLKDDIIKLYEKLDCLDIINLSCYAGGLLPPKDYEPNPPKKISEDTWEDKRGRIFKYSKETADIILVKDETVWDEDFSKEHFENLELSKPCETEFEVIDEVIEHFQGKKFIISPSGADIGIILLGGYERGLTEFLTNPDGVRAAYKFYTEQENLNDSVRIRKGTDAVLFQNDYSFNSGCFISPKMLEDFSLEAMQKRVKNAKKYVSFVMKHSCGNNNLILPYFAKIGIDCYQGVQPTAGMDIFAVHREWQDKFAVWGGISVENYISGGEIDIEREARRIVTEMIGKSRFIAGSSHSIAVGTKYDNFMKYLDIMSK